jgi:small-conductance mechanosensitive channel
MLLSLLIISWLVFGTMAAAALFYKNQRDHQVLGVTLSAAHAQSPEAQELIRRYKRACYLVLLLSAALSLLLLVKPFAFYAEFYLLILLIVNLFLHWLVIHRYRQKLSALKEEKAWIYPRTRVLTVDMNVVKEKGKAGFLLSGSGVFPLEFYPRSLF